MDIENETRAGQKLRPPHRLHGYHIARAGPVLRPGRLAVDQQAAGLGQRHAERFHHMTQRRGPVQRHRHRAAAPPRPQEQRQLSRDDHQRLRPVHPVSMPAHDTLALTPAHARRYSGPG